MSLFDPERPTVGLLAGRVASPDPLLVVINRRGDAPVGPCRYEPRRIPVATADGHVHLADAGTPPVGTECLVGFVDGDESQPWVIAFIGWPTGA
ncbi:hypothetical protein [Euzebya rosea]|uniref:hypothetical protein n=1 Tax=Euzebya rosea TaxID=2052804 RepID=UPI000D3EDFC6|nr:hypothetical protein [Euzebya rosea]